jgi:hypothetical protein
MKDYLIMAAKIGLAVFLIVTFIIGAASTDTFQGQSSRIGTKQVTDLKTVAP